MFAVLYIGKYLHINKDRAVVQIIPLQVIILFFLIDKYLGC